eukprot:4908608-Prymnesium_polylepis.1
MERAPEALVERERTSATGDVKECRRGYVRILHGVGRIFADSRRIRESSGTNFRGPPGEGRDGRPRVLREEAEVVAEREGRRLDVARQLADEADREHGVDGRDDETDGRDERDDAEQVAVHVAIRVHAEVH